MEEPVSRLLNYGVLGIFCAILLTALLMLARAYASLQKQRFDDMMNAAAKAEERDMQRRAMVDANTQAQREATIAVNQQTTTVATLVASVNANTQATSSMRDAFLTRSRSSDRMPAVRKE